MHTTNRTPAAGSSHWHDELRDRLDALIDEHRAMLRASIEALSEEEARRRLVPSKTTLLGLVKHATYVERVWFGQAVTGTPLAELGVAATPTRSFTLSKGDTIDSVTRTYDTACEASRENVSGLSLDETVTGRQPRALWAIYTHMLRELAQHCGHADILREQILAARSDAV